MTYLTERQRDILDFIRSFRKKKGVAPTHREICDAFGFSSYGTVYKHLSLLEKKGLIRRDWNQKRSVEIVEDDERPAVRELPLLGTIAAGLPLEVHETAETYAVPDSLTGRGENFVLKVRGESMIEDGILDGDFVIIERSQIGGKRSDGRRDGRWRGDPQAVLPRRGTGPAAAGERGDGADLRPGFGRRDSGTGDRTDASVLTGEMRRPGRRKHDENARRTEASRSADRARMDPAGAGCALWNRSQVDQLVRDGRSNRIDEDRSARESARSVRSLGP